MGRPATLTDDELAPETVRLRSWYASKDDWSDISPKAKMALRMYTFGSCTMKEAAAICGISPIHLGQLVNRSPAAREYMTNTQQMLDDKALDTTALISRLSRRAVEVIAHTMENAGSEALRLKAAQDLADRAPDSSKIQRHQVESFTLAGHDARQIADAIADSAKTKSKFALLASGNIDNVSEPEAEAEGSPKVTPTAEPANVAE